jgi:hypothetical protein
LIRYNAMRGLRLDFVASRMRRLEVGRAACRERCGTRPRVAESLGFSASVSRCRRCGGAIAGREGPGPPLATARPWRRGIVPGIAGQPPA